MRDLSDLKLVRRRRNTYPSPNKRDVHRFEKRFGVTLPQEYLAFLNQYNGCESQGKLRFKVDEAIYGISDFFGLGPEPKEPLREGQNWDFGNLWDETIMRSSVLTESRVPIARDGGGSLLFLDFSGDPPFVGYLAGSTRKRLKLFPDFESFIDAVFLKGEKEGV